MFHCLETRRGSWGRAGARRSQQRMPLAYDLSMAEARWVFHRRGGEHGGLKGAWMADFQTVKRYVHELNLVVVHEDPAQHILVVEDTERGINHLVIDCEEPLLIFEQMMLDVPAHPGDMFRRLLQMNRTLVHGAFALTEGGKQVLFR